MANRHRLALLAGVALIAPTGMARAQVAEAPAEQGGLAEITVTATRRVENLQDTAVAVSAIPPVELQYAVAPDIRDLVGRVPTLVLDPVNAGPSAAAISIRGISFEDIEKSFDPAVGVLIDGVYLGTNTGQLLDFFDFESIEVLRGPQGVLFGRNTTAGVINIERTKPTGEWGATGSAIWGNVGRQDYGIVLNTPVLFDLISFKFFWRHNQNGDFYDNVVLGKDYGGRNIDNYGFAARINKGAVDAIVTVEQIDEQTEIDQASLSLTGVDTICLPLLPGILTAPRIECDRTTEQDLYTTFTNVPGIATAKTNAITANIVISTDLITVTSITGYRAIDESVRQDFDSTSINFFDTLRVQDYSQISQELRFSGDITDNINFVAGGYYFQSSYHLDQTTYFGLLLQGAGLPPQGGNIVDHKGSSMAVFADVQWQVTDRIMIDLGGRYNWDNKSIVNDYLKTGLPALIAVGSQSWEKFQPRASIQYDFGEGDMVYFLYAQGYRAGGFNGRGQTAVSASTPYDPENVNSYEGGIRTTWLDNRLTANLTAFLTKYTDKQEEIVRPAPPPAGQETIVTNAATATIWGLEFESRALPLPNLEVWAAVGYLNAQYDDFATLIGGTLVDISGRNLRRTPNITSGIGANWTLPIGPGELITSGSWRYTSQYDTTIVGAWFDPTINDPRGIADARNVIDLSTTYTFELRNVQWKAVMFVRNLLNDEGLSAALPVAGLFTFGAARPLRSWGGSIGFSF
jgi:iron complex outermembrane receptor protein